MESKEYYENLIIQIPKRQDALYQEAEEITMRLKAIIDILSYANDDLNEAKDCLKIIEETEKNEN
jgi:hypothetical protein